MVPLERVEASNNPYLRPSQVMVICVCIYIYLYLYICIYMYMYLQVCYIYNTRIQKSPKPNLSLATLLDRIEKRFFV